MLIGNVVGIVMLVASVLAVGVPLHFVGVKNEAVMAWLIGGVMFAATVVDLVRH